MDFVKIVKRKGELDFVPSTRPTGKYASTIIAEAERVGTRYWITSMHSEFARQFGVTRGARMLGLAIPTDDGGMAIYSSGLGSTVKAYATVHEICHVRLHGNSISSRAMAGQRGWDVSTKQEYEAETCAMAWWEHNIGPVPSAIKRQVIVNLQIQLRAEKRLGRTNYQPALDLIKELKGR